MSSNNTYLGAQDQGTTASEYNARDFHIQQRLDERNGATLVQIVRAPYDANGNAITPGSAVAVGFVDVLPLVNQVNGQGQATPHGTVYKLSYFRYAGGNGAVICDPVKGDQGKMVVADRDTSVVKTTKAQGNPGSGRRSNLADGTYFGLTQGGAPTQYVAFTATGITITDKNGNTVVMSASGIVATDKSGNKITMASGSINLAPSGGGFVTVGSGAHFVLINGGSGISTNLKADG